MYWACARLQLRCQLLYLRMRNVLVRHTTLSCDGPIVSLTTYGKRCETVYYTLESIARGRLLPSRIILWLDEPPAMANLPAELKRLEKRGLEIRLTENLGPHTKYYPYLEITESFNLPLVTADDDVLYPRDWLSGLASSYKSRPDLIHCYRAHVVAIVDGAIAPYATWKPCVTTDESYLNFSTGVSGAIYPPAFLGALKRNGKDFLSCCLRADDIWLHVTAIRSGFKIRQLGKHSMLFAEVPNTQDVTLWHDNVYKSGNDSQIAKTYSRKDIELLLASVA